MKQNSNNKNDSVEPPIQQTHHRLIEPHRGLRLKNMAAFHELMRREGYYVPAISSRFVNKRTLNMMYRGEIFSLRQKDVVYRECVKPPTKLVLVQKYEQYLSAIDRPSGIDIAEMKFPDKAWLVLMVASLSEGTDEIFDPEYLPNRNLANRFMREDE